MESLGLPLRHVFYRQWGARVRWEQIQRSPEAGLANTKAIALQLGFLTWGFGCPTVKVVVLIWPQCSWVHKQRSWDFQRKKDPPETIWNHQLEIHLVVSLPVPTGDQSPEGAKQEVQVHQTLCPCPGLLQLTGVCRMPGLYNQGPVLLQAGPSPTSQPALHREINHCPCQIAFHLCYEKQQKVFFSPGSKLSPGHKPQIQLQSWASTHNWTLHLTPVFILSWSPQCSVSALGASGISPHTPSPALNHSFAPRPPCPF